MSSPRIHLVCFPPLIMSWFSLVYEDPIPVNPDNYHALTVTLLGFLRASKLHDKAKVD